jgi:hypothetical protein
MTSKQISNGGVGGIGNWVSPAMAVPHTNLILPVEESILQLYE